MAKISESIFFFHAFFFSRHIVSNKYQQMWRCGKIGPVGDEQSVEQERG